MRRLIHYVLFLSLFAATALLTGCAYQADSVSTPPATSLGTLEGKVIGGNQPIAGASVYVYAASTAGYNMPSTSLLTSYTTGNFPTTVDANGNYYVTTDSNGNFSISGEYTCTAATQVYLYAVGGNAGSGINSAAGLLAVLGRCPSNGTLSGTVPSVIVNEVTTVATAYAIAGFATDATDVSSSVTPLATVGVANAFANAGQMVNIASANWGALAVTPGGTGTVPQAEINTLADVLASCINSSGPGSTACSTLLSTATFTGTPAGANPTDTATAAIYIAQHPSLNVATLFGLVGTTPPFVPLLTTQPNDFSISISFTGGGIGASNGHAPHNVAIDALGNVYTTSPSTNTLTIMSPLGTFNKPNGITGNGLSGPTSVAVSITSSSVYVANATGQSVSRFLVTGTPSGKVALGDNIEDAELDGSGNIWSTGSTGPQIFEYAPTTGSTVSSFTGNGLSSPLGLALSSGTAGNIWVDNGGTDDMSAFANDGTPLNKSPFTTGTGRTSVGIAIDVVGLIWVTNSDGSVGLFSATGTAVPGSPYSVGKTSLDGIAIDGDDRIWASSPGDGTIYELGGVSRSGISAIPFNALPAASPDGLAIDCSGNLWYDTTTDNTLREVIGLATPVITPIAFGVASMLLATRP
jgi:sugar lactone lactonase YvrE